MGAGTITSAKDAEKMRSYQGKLAQSKETLHEGLRLFERLEKQLERVYMYAKLNLDVDNSDANIRQCMTGRLAFCSAYRNQHLYHARVNINKTGNSARMGKCR